MQKRKNNLFATLNHGHIENFITFMVDNSSIVNLCSMFKHDIIRSKVCVTVQKTKHDKF